MGVPAVGALAVRGLAVRSSPRLSSFTSFLSAKRAGRCGSAERPPVNAERLRAERYPSAFK